MDLRTDPTLVEAVRDAVGRSVRALESVDQVPLAYDPFLPGRDLRRLRGVALTDGGRLPWSLVEKRTDGPATASAYQVDNGRREFAAYASGLLDDVAPRIRTPRAHALDERPDGALVLWLEDVGPGLSRPLGPATLLAVARDLGGMAGRWLGRPPREPWMFTGWITRHSQPEAMEAGLEHMRRAASSADVQARIGHHLDDAIALVGAQDRVAAILAELPETLCHHDAVGANVMAAGADGSPTILIDWESIGPGPVGADLASLLFASARRGDSDASALPGLMDEAVDEYLGGVAEENAHAIDEATVRRGLDASICLRWTLARDIARSVDEGRAPRRGSRPDEPPEQALEELIRLADVLMDAARRTIG